jgi:hypothetical protein
MGNTAIELEPHRCACVCARRRSAPRVIRRVLDYRRDNQRLLDYVRDGGNLIVLYNT